jgi:bacillithiol synthase
LSQDSISFRQLGFSRLFSDYCAQSSQILEFFEYNPFDPNALVTRNDIQPDSVPGRLEEALKAYNPEAFLHDTARTNLKELVENPKCRTITTGQQLTFAGGPIFTMFKILTAISEAVNLSKVTGDPVVPIFWLADEDQDFDEIASITFPSGADVHTLTLDQPQVEAQRAGYIPVTQDVLDRVEELVKLLPETEFHEEITALLRNAYSLGNTHNYAFSQLILKLFSRFGLLVFGSARPESRELLKESFRDLISISVEIHHALESVSAALEQNYHRQVSVSSSNWFICSPDGSRTKLTLDDGIWSTSDGQSYTTEQLASMVYDDPNLLSPNVFMRPVLQDILLPNLGIVSGPGEVAYYAQTREMYMACKRPMPVVIPRFSGMLLEPSIVKNLSELPFEIADFSKRHEDLETEFVQKIQEQDLNAFFEEWSEQIVSLAESKMSVVESIDPTLVGTLKRIETDQSNALNQLKAKIFKAVKSRQDTQIKRIHRVQNNLYPGRVIQERSIGFIYFICKYGSGVLDRILQEVESRSLDSHHIIEL